MGDQQFHQPTSDQIARAAYLLWEREGRPNGRDVAHWLRAERQLMAGADGTASTRDPSAKPGAEMTKRPASGRRSGPKRSETAKV